MSAIKPRKFQDVYDIGRNAAPNVRELASMAFASLAGTEHGEAIREYFASVRLEILNTQNEGAWREHQARQKFADEILVMMEGPNARRSK